MLNTILMESKDNSIIWMAIFKILNMAY